MRKLTNQEIVNVTGGTGGYVAGKSAYISNTPLPSKNSVEYGDLGLHSVVVVPPSKKGQIMYVKVEVVEDDLMHKLNPLS